MMPSVPRLPDALIRSQNARNTFNGSKMLQAVPKRSQTFPSYFYANAYSHTIPYHTIPYHTRPYGVMLTIPPYTPQKPCIWDRPGNLYQVLHVLQIQTSSFSRCVCVPCKKHIGNLYLSVAFGKCKVRSLGHSCFWGLGALFIT